MSEPASPAVIDPPDFEAKLCRRDHLAARVAALPQPVVMTNGVFDILHRGHVTYLAQARALGAALVVAVNTDASVKRLGKGADRPLNSCADRMAVLAALAAVTLVVEFDEDTALEVVLQARPQIYAKGGDYDMRSIAEGRAVLAYGGQAVAIEFQHQRSTTALLRRVRATEGMA
ncbi:MAG: adenylyltransferase/cytidyltransferase family protein [Pseudomonadota bacterium]|nr:adenylyltransferase/cytidyltransferase family protein [Pseudomonadota bacterium]